MSLFGIKSPVSLKKVESKHLKGCLREQHFCLPREGCVGPAGVRFFCLPRACSTVVLYVDVCKKYMYGAIDQWWEKLLSH